MELEAAIILKLAFGFHMGMTVIIGWIRTSFSNENLISLHFIPSEMAITTQFGLQALLANTIDLCVKGES